MLRAPSARRPSPKRVRLKHLCLGVLSLVVSLGLTAGGCGTDAIGIDACRDIELARCDAAQYCGKVDDVEACRRFYRDHCLHGLRTGIEQPTPDVVDACVATIKRAGKCAKGDRHATLDECGPPVVTKDPRGAVEACDIVLFPEYASECKFLGPLGELPERPGSGGQGGAP